MLIERFSTLAEATGHRLGHLVTELLANELERSPAWLAAEEGRISSTQHYITVRDEGRVLAMAFCYPVPHDAVHRAYAARELLLGAPVDDLLARRPGVAVGPTGQQLAELRDRLPAAATDTLAVVAPGSVLPGVVTDARATAPARQRALRLLVEAVRQLAAELTLPIVEFVHIRDDVADRELHEVLRELSFAPVLVGADAVLQARFADLDEYFAGFRANRRKVLRKERARFLALRPVVTLQGPEGLTEDLVELQLARYRHYGHQADAEAVRDRFTRAASVPGLKVLRADASSGLLGFVAFYEHRRGGRLVPRFGAFARDRNGGYFNLAYYELIAHAARSGGMRIHYGDSTYAAKASRGCDLTTLTTYLWSPDPTLHQLLCDAVRVRTFLEERELAAAGPGGPDTLGVSVLFDAAGTLFDLAPPAARAGRPVGDGGRWHGPGRGAGPGGRPGRRDCGLARRPGDCGSPGRRVVGLPGPGPGDRHGRLAGRRSQPVRGRAGHRRRAGSEPVPAIP